MLNNRVCKISSRAVSLLLMLYLLPFMAGSALFDSNSPDHCAPSAQFASGILETAFESTEPTQQPSFTHLDEESSFALASGKVSIDFTALTASFPCGTVQHLVPQTPPKATPIRAPPSSTIS
ncbi:hypothetical protein [Pseudodesulfovibrio sp. zrk46]|uniref:hypothetical protein n=1 Tax=Pseudodesulfovibrio sp. zrk46 TaxID=2725288 RepID=UPI00144A2323|nr:hypothetical protein [Pseudodesulfovibrio sp. zrk46]QJB56226.1 hypothetical protein HFN16_07290 [Pseudodesulfovibrio sp. zrk46]